MKGVTSSPSVAEPLVDPSRVLKRQIDSSMAEMEMIMEDIRRVHGLINSAGEQLCNVRLVLGPQIPVPGLTRNTNSTVPTTRVESDD
jgi:hypothetical protein